MDANQQCVGCGVTLQSADSMQKGFVPENVWQDSIKVGRPTTCQRCYRLTHYHQQSPISIASDAYATVLHRIEQESGLIAHVIDITDMEATWIDALPRFVGRRTTWLIINKVDVLPKGTSLARMKERIWKFVRAQAWHVAEVWLVSAHDGTGIEEVVQAMRAWQRVFFVGCANVGKSSLVRRLVAYEGGSSAQMTAAPFPGTTLDLVRASLPNGREYVDTPGVINGNRLIERLPVDQVTQWLAKGAIKPMTCALGVGKSIWMDRYIRIDAVKQPVHSLTFYVAPGVRIRRSALREERSSDAPLLDPARPEQVATTSWRFVHHRVVVPVAGVCDLAIGGVGWVCVHAGAIEVQLEVWAPPAVQITERPPLLGGRLHGSSLEISRRVSDNNAPRSSR